MHSGTTSRLMLLGVALGGCAVSRRADHCEDPAPTQIRPEAFDRARWLAGCPADRIAMARALADSHALDGATASELEARLGTSARCRSLPSGAPDGACREWRLGARASGAGFFFPYDEALEIQVGADGRATRALVVNRD